MHAELELESKHLEYRHPCVALSVHFSVTLTLYTYNTFMVIEYFVVSYRGFL